MKLNRKQAQELLAQLGIWAKGLGRQGAMPLCLLGLTQDDRLAILPAQDSDGNFPSVEDISALLRKASDMLLDSNVERIRYRDGDKPPSDEGPRF